MTVRVPARFRHDAANRIEAETSFGGMSTVTTHPRPDAAEGMAVRGSGQGRRAAARVGAGASPVRDRVRPVRAAAYRHLRRGRAHDLGAERLHAADRRPAVAPARLQRRHGRAAQGAGQRAEPGHAGGAPGQAAHRHPRPVRHACELRRPQQRAAARLPRRLRLRVRVRLLDRVLPGRTLRRGAAAHGRAARGGARGDPAHPRAGAAGDLLALPARPPAHRRGDAGADGGGAAGGRPAGLARPGQRRAARHAHHRRALQGAVEGRLGAALVRARRRLRDVGQGSDRQREALLAGVPHPGRRAAGGLHLRAFPRRGGAEDQQEQGQRPDHRGMAALRPAGVPRRSSCTRRRSARSGCSST